MKKHHKIQKIEFLDHQMIMKIDEHIYVWDLKNISSTLAKAKDFELEKFEISPSGYGIHWPLLDEDLSVDGLLKMKKSSCARSTHHHVS